MSDDDSVDPAALEDVEFPRPRSECVAAVDATRAYIEEHDGATRDEIVRGLAPEKNHRIGLTGAQLVGKMGMVDGLPACYIVGVSPRASPTITSASGTWRRRRSSFTSTSSDRTRSGFGLPSMRRPGDTEPVKGDSGFGGPISERNWYVRILCTERSKVNIPVYR